MEDKVSESPYIDEFARLAEAVIEDYYKAVGGNKAANVRVRNNLIHMRDLVIPFRKHCMQLRETEAYNRDADV